MGLGVPMDGSHVRIAELAQGRRGRVGVTASNQELGNESGRLQLRDVGLEEDAIDRTARQGHPIAK
jgi:hypothetical protein